MPKPHLLVAFAVLLHVGPAPAQPAAAPKDPLEPLAWLIGTWAAAVKGPDGAPLAFRTTFDWAGHKKALKFAVTFKAKDATVAQYEGMYYWHPGKKCLAMLQIDRYGNVTESSATVDGKNMTQVNVVAVVDGAKREQRVEMIRYGDDAFTFRALVPKDGRWAEAVAFRYTRVPAGK